MPKDTMTSIERWWAVLNREKVDRVPLNFMATPEATKILMQYLGVNSQGELLNRLHVDRKIVVWPKYVGPTLPQNVDEYGIQFHNMDYGIGEYAEAVGHPLANYSSVDEIEQEYRWPDPDWWDYSGMPDQLVGYEDYPVWGGGSEPFLIYKQLRGMEQAYMDLVLNPEMVHYCMDKLFEIAYQKTLRTYEAVPGKVTMTYISEDLGSQESLLFSRKQIKEFLIPRMKRIMDLAHDAGAAVYHHSDGAIRETLPDMIKAGIDILNPIQWRCKGMEREGLKRDFGDQIIFHGAMDNQYTLAFGSVQEVQQEVLDNLRILGEGGGYIMAPCHRIQSISPPENIVAMYDCAYENGWY